MEILLHNHPAMAVFSNVCAAQRRCKRINGRMEITNTRAHKPRVCELVSDVVITALDDSVQVCSPKRTFTESSRLQTWRY